ncbi:MAG: dienelactone hydrolase family protein, partial [Halofilum sp. (in: g-proteobacteria)]
LCASGAQAGESISYEADSGQYEGYFAEASDPKGLVLVIHDWDGLTDYERKRADMLAELGYDAFAVDLYGQGNRPVDTSAKKAETAKLYEDREKMRALILAGLGEARRLGETNAVVMGYCFGGAAVLELARSGEAENIEGYATFHGGLSTPDGQSYSSDTAPILVAHGGADASVTMQDVASLSNELEEGGVPYEIQVYSGAPHAFSVFNEDRYHERADRKSWSAFSSFLESNLGR